MSERTEPLTLHEQVKRTRERYLNAQERFVRARQHYLEAIEARWRVWSSTHPGSLASTQAHHDALVDRAVATRLTLMSCREMADGETAALLDAAIEGCDRIARCAGALAGQGGDHTYLWVADLHEIDQFASAIYAHVKGGAGGAAP